jgi:hypothetical protein
MLNGYRQEVLNVLLAQLLQERGIVSAPESVTKGLDSRRKMPDVIVNFNGLRTAIEGEVDDTANAEKKAVESARRRVDESVAHIGLAVIYPSSLRKEKFTQLKAKLANCELKLTVVTELGDRGFVTGNVDYLESALRHVFEELTKEDIVAQAVAVIDSTIENFAGILSYKDATITRVAECLGIHELPDDNSEDEDDE